MSAIGKPLSRVEGRKKVTGGAIYTADAAPEGAYHAALVNSTIANGRIKRLNTEEAARAPGVVSIFTSANMIRFKSCRHRGITIARTARDTCHCRTI